MSIHTLHRIIIDGKVMPYVGDIISLQTDKHLFDLTVNPFISYDVFQPTWVRLTFSTPHLLFPEAMNVNARLSDDGSSFLFSVGGGKPVEVTPYGEDWLQDGIAIMDTFTVQGPGQFDLLQFGDEKVVEPDGTDIDIHSFFLKNGWFIGVNLPHSTITFPTCQSFALRRQEL